MAEELNREQVTERMQAIFRSSLEGDELDKALSSIDKRLDKFEGKWDGLIKWAETKYGKPQETSDSSDSEGTQVEEPKKKRGMFGLGKKKEQASAESGQPEEPEAAKEAPSNQEEKSEMSREEATQKLESIFSSALRGEELEKMLDSIPQRLDKFEGKWPKLVLWAEEKYPVTDPEESVVEEQVEAGGIEETLQLIIGGNLEAALSNLKKMVAENPNDADAWRGMASYFSSMGMTGRSEACEQKAETLA